MGDKNEQHNPSSYAELILFNTDLADTESDQQQLKEPKRLIPGMFSSISDAELITQRLTAELVETDE